MVGGPVDQTKAVGRGDGARGEGDGLDGGFLALLILLLLIEDERFPKAKVVVFGVSLYSFVQDPPGRLHVVLDRVEVPDDLVVGVRHGRVEEGDHA